LLVSGGHCQCIAVEGIGQHTRLGGTIDDAAGEAFDKVAKLLGLGWPGGPALEKLATEGNPAAFPFPRPLLGRPGCDFSFSGLKTSVAQTIATFPPGALPRQTAADIAASFQITVARVIADRAGHAMAMFTERHPNAAKLLVVAGGVAANTAIRIALLHACTQQGFRFAAPPLKYCTDNAVMVAWTGLERLRLGLVDNMNVAPRPRWPLAELAR
jgi:N6-L-threonylcarbamoyladenine synthase